ncbi:MAG: DUF4097 family beta strand repeat protein [Acidobacteria bacterium]|nr:DUF4097 family beta strand repeat protein [Acidobacteriota bacterium]
MSAARLGLATRLRLICNFVALTDVLARAWAGRALVVAAVLAVSSACTLEMREQGYTAREEKRFTAGELPDITLVTFDGSIDIRSWDRAEVLVEVEKRAGTKEAVDAIQVQAEQTGNQIRVEARRPGGVQPVFGFRFSRMARLVASVPRKCNLMARSADGSIRIERVAGRIELRTGDGSIRGYDVSGDLSVNTGDGSVRLDSSAGRLDVSTGDGSVDLSGRMDAVRVHTGDGTISLRAEPGSSMSADWDLASGDGGVVVYLPPDFNASLDAHTGDGSIRTDRDLTITFEGEIDRRTLRGKLGNGGKLLKVRTSDGSISFRTS